MPKKVNNTEALIKKFIALEVAKKANKNANGGGSRKRANKRRKNNTISMVVPPSVPAGFTGTMGPRSGPKYQSLPAGGLSFRHTEFWDTLKTTANSTESFSMKKFHPGQSGIAHLDSLAKVYERFKLTQCTLHYRTLVGTSTNGAITLAVDWDIIPDAPTSHSEVSVKNPSRRSAIWQEFNLVLPSPQLMDRKIKPTYSDKTDTKLDLDDSSFAFVTALTYDSQATVRSLGEIWVSYHIELLGPKKA